MQTSKLVLERQHFDIKINMYNVKKIKEQLMAEFEMKDLRKLKTFLGIEIERNYEKKILQWNQSRYLESLLIKFRMQDCKGSSKPVENNLILETCETAWEFIDKPYTVLIGCIMYVMTTTRPDLSYANN